MPNEHTPVALTDKVCIVTGSARGIGRGIAEEMTRHGARVVLNDVDPEPLEAAVTDLRAGGGTVIGVAADVSTVEGGERLTQAAIDAWGRVDVLVNNAGICSDAMFHKMTIEQWDRVHAIHARALFTCTQPVVRHLITRQKKDPDYTGGSIICTTSTSGLAGNVGQTNYGSAKAAVVGFVLSLAKEMERRGIRVNAVAPTAYTRLVSAIPDAVLLQHIGEDGIARMKAQRPEHIAPLVCFLASDAAEGITGQIVRAAGASLGLFSHPRSKLDATIEGEWTIDDVAQTFQGWQPELETLCGLGDL